MRTLLNRIFLRKLGLGRFFLAGFAFLAGFTLVLLALQGYVKVRNYLAPRKSTSNFIIINKEVALAHTLFGSKAQFTDEEIKDLQAQSFVEDLGVFKSNTFEVIAHAGGNLGFYTELFFESVPARFLDKKPADFAWEEGSDFLPLIISQDFLDLYNFGYAVGKGTPQLSKSTVQLVPLRVDVVGPRGREKYDAKVVGFSERIASVLVPEEFLTWANANIGNPTDQKKSRVIIKMKTDGANELNAYLGKHSLTVSDEKMKLGKMLAALDIFMAAAALIGTGFMVFSLVIFILNFSLMVAQAREEVSLLLQLGYSGRQLVNHLSIYLLVFMVCVTAASAGVWTIGNHYFIGFLITSGMEVTMNISREVYILAGGFLLVSMVLSYYSIYRLIRKQIIAAGLVAS